MNIRVLGLHHMTAISGPAQENVDFYAGVLGLRLVKTTVNFDDPGAHHLYYGDGLGSPGSILTFFPYPSGRQGRIGNGMVGVTSLAVPPESLSFWIDRLAAHAVAFEMPVKRGDSEVIGLTAPDGLPLELVAGPDYVAGEAWRDMIVPAEHAIGAMHGVRIFAEDAALTGKVLTGLLGYEEAGGLEDSAGARYRVQGDRAAVLDVLERPGAGWGVGGHGTVHHIAFRASDDAAQLQFQEKIQAEGLHVSPVMDRNYFHSIYFREPGHVLFEIATDGPGFAVDETPEGLGTSLKLPEQYEPHRATIEAALPKLRVPEPVR